MSNSNTRRRVKLYVLNDERAWDDHGTGHVSTLFMDHDKQVKGIVLLVRSEEDGKVLLESRISTDTVYQKQLATLVVWSEAESDLALSFQEKEGCDEIWEKICQVQGKDPSVDITKDVMDEQDEPYEEVHDYSVPIELPSCELSKLDEISELFHSVLASDSEQLATAIEQEEYVKKLIDIFHMCEDLENIEGLHTLFEIFKSLFMLEKNSLFEVMFSSENILDVVGILEYDPTRKEHTQHRQFLIQKVKFKEAIPISNTELVQKIHQTHQIQYIKDILVPVPSLFDENMSTINSILFFNKIQIVNLIQEDPHFLDELFTKLTDNEISDHKRKETILLLRELCTLSQSLHHENRDAALSQTLHQENRDTFLKTLSDHGLLATLEQLMNLDDMEIRSAIVDVICCVVDFNPSFVREYLSKEANTRDEDSMLLNMLIDMLLTSSDSGMGVILLQLIRNLLDPENMSLGTNKMEKSEFLGFFYRHCMQALTIPLHAVTSSDKLGGKDDFKQATVLDYVIDLFTFCVDHHSYHIRNYIIGKKILGKVLVLMQSKHKFLALAALRFCRKIIGMKDEFYNRYIIVEKLLQPVVKAFLSNGQRYNLLNSAIIELFEFIRLEDIKTICAYVVENHIDSFNHIHYVDTFKGLRVRYQQEKDRLKINNSEREPNTGIIHSSNSLRARRDDRVLDEYEENYFDGEDDDKIPLAQTNDTDSSATKPLSAKLKDVDLLDNIPLSRSESPVRSLNRPNSPQNALRPGSPQPRPGSPQQRPESPQNALRQISPQNSLKQDGVLKPNSPNNNKCPTAVQNHVNRLPLTKQIPGVKHKPVMNIKINSNSTSILNSNNETHNDISKDALTNNGATAPLSIKISEQKEANSESLKEVIPLKTKSLLTSLVDYPDDDDESTDEDEIPSSPAKKQRISSS